MKIRKFKFDYCIISIPRKYEDHENIDTSWIWFLNTFKHKDVKDTHFSDNRWLCAQLEDKVYFQGTQGTLIQRPD